jgi:hypothetical protein
MADESSPLQALTDEAALKEATRWFGRAFTRTPDTPLQPTLEHRAIISFNTKHRSDERKLAALIAAMCAVGEDSFYVTGLLADRDRFWLVTPDSLPVYAEGNEARSRDNENLFLFETALYSTHGTWAIWMLEDSYALVGSSAPEFLETLLARYPSMDAPVEFVRFQRWLADDRRTYDALQPWVIEVMEHI